MMFTDFLLSHQRFQHTSLALIQFLGPIGTQQTESRPFDTGRTVFLKDDGIQHDMGYSWDIHGIFMGYSWDIHGIFMGYSWDIHGIFMGSMKV